MKKELIIRILKNEEIPLLEDFLYTAVFCPPENPPYPKNIINIPAIYEYIKDFGKKDDICLIAEKNHTPAGAIWSRILPLKIKRLWKFCR